MGEVIDFKNKEQSTDPVVFLEMILQGIKDGKISGINTGVLMMYHADDSIGTFAFGPMNDDFHTLSVIECGKHVLLQDICGV